MTGDGTAVMEMTGKNAVMEIGETNSEELAESNSEMEIAETKAGMEIAETKAGMDIVETNAGMGTAKISGVVDFIWAVAEARRSRRPGRAVTAKRLGEMAEAAFLARASRLGFGVAKPWGDSERYDFILHAPWRTRKRLWRVQVKSAHKAGADGGYSIRAHGHSLETYTADEIDLLVAYCVPEDAWYVFPMKEVERHRSMKLYPGSRRKRSKFEKYREAWGIVEGRRE